MAASDSILAPFLKQTTVKEAAAWAADPYDADKRARGTVLLANAPFGGADAYIALYRQHVKDDNINVKMAGARGLALHGTPEDVPALVDLTKHTDKSVRLEGTRALQRLHNPVAIPALIDRLNLEKEQEPDIRAEAASALGQYAELRSLTALVNALADPSLLVDMNALDSLKTLTGQEDLPLDKKAWASWQKANSTPFAARKPYVYPIFWREKRWIDYLPIVGGPVPNETAATPAGFPDLGTATP